jgi:hypothetical protein
LRQPALLAIVAVAAAGCMVFRGPGARLSVTASGTFDCGSGVHGCRAWLAIRPAGWTPPPGWSPGLADRDLRPTPAATDRAHWTVSGSGQGGPERLEAGSYRVHAVITEVSDIEPDVLGTDDHPGTGVIATTIACEIDLKVPAASTEVGLKVDFSPCSIEATFAS